MYQITRHYVFFSKPKTPTYLHPTTGTFSCIDVLVHLDLFFGFDWTVMDDQDGSDDFQLLLTLNDSVPNKNINILKLKLI